MITPGKQKIIEFAKSQGWDVEIETNGTARLKFLYPSGKIKHSGTLTAYSLFFPVQYGRQVSPNSIAAIRSHKEMKECLEV